MSTIVVMSPENDFKKQLEAKYLGKHTAPTERDIRRKLHIHPTEQVVPLQPIPIEHPQGHHLNEAEKVRKGMCKFLSRPSFRSWIKTVEYDEEMGSDIYIDLDEDTIEGEHLCNLIGYSNAVLRVMTTEDKIKKFMKKNLAKGSDISNWIINKQVVLDGSSDEMSVTADLLFQMGLLSENLFTESFAAEFVHSFDASTQMIMGTPDIIKPVVYRRMPIVHALFGEFCSNDIHADVNQLANGFSLTR